MTTVISLGAGRLARQLMPQLEIAGCRVLQVYSRTAAAAQALAAKLREASVTTAIPGIRTDADLYIIAVSDDAIQPVAGELYALQAIGGIVVHTSGSRGIDVLPFEKRGAFYPLQTFSDSHAVRWDTTPVLITAENEEIKNALWEIAKKITSSVYEITDDQKAVLHVAAVFANNFTNHLLVIAERICLQHHVPFDILKPLISETVAKALEAGPSVSQTGPAIRGDMHTIEQHLSMLEGDRAELYRSLTESIRRMG